MTYLLDTIACIAAMRGNAPARQRLSTVAPTDCGLSVVSLYELSAGVERCRHPVTERQKVDLFGNALHVLPFDRDAAEHTARTRWHLERQGQTI